MSRVRTSYLRAALLVLTAAAYLPLWNNDFIDLDDEPYITRNPGITQGLTGPGFVWAWTNSEAPYWHPVTWLSLQLDAQCFSSCRWDGQRVLSPRAFHAENLLWHVAAALLLFGLWHRLTGARWCSFLVAALFALHPMHVESVAWAIERKDVLSGFFGVLTLWAYVRYVERPGRGRYLGMALALLLSLLSKPMLMTLPLALLLLDIWPLRRLKFAGLPSGPHGRSPRQLVLEKLPLLALASGVAVITLAIRAEHGSLVGLHALPLSARGANALAAYGSYLAGSFYPARLTVLYPHRYENWTALSVLAGTAALLSISALSLWQARRRPWLLVGWFWFAGSLVPVIGLVQGGGQAWADRFSYWPHIGLFTAVVFGLKGVMARARVPAWIPIGAGTLVLAGLAALTWRQVGYWRNTQTLWEHTVAVTEDNARAHQHLATCYRNHGQLDEAEFHLFAGYRIQARRLAGAAGSAHARRMVPASGQRPITGPWAAAVVASASVMP